MNKFYKLNKARGKASRDEQVWVSQTAEIVAACRVKNISSHLLLLGLMVTPQERGKGTGQALVQAVLTAQSQDVYTFAYRKLIPWYEKLGFQLIAIEDAAHEISEKFIIYQKQGRDIALMRWCYQGAKPRES